MATAPNVPNFSQYNFEIGDTTEVVTKQNGLNSALADFGNSLSAMTDSIDQDLSAMEGLKSDTETAASNAATSETNAASSASNAATSETNAASSASNAATSETNAASRASAASTSESNAATSETNAANSASAADLHEDNALAAANSAASSWDAIRSRYYGPLAEDPSTDPLGNAPAAGDRYLNTTESVEKSYNGSAWVYNEIGTHEAAPDPHAQYEWRVQHNTTANAAPTASDDESAGYSARSTWFDTSATPPEAYRCIDATAGAAVWVQTSLTLDELGTAASRNVVSSATDSTANRLATNARLDIWVRDVERAQLEAATGGACTVERTPNGQPSYMFVFPKLAWGNLVPGGELGTGTHEAFIENGVEKSELLIGMYMASEVNGELVSQPRTTGRRSIDWDQSVAAASAVNMNLLGNWEWSAIAFWCMANGWQPRGNTDYGVSHSHPHERGVYDGDGSGEEYTLLGSGPNTWSHNNAANGLADLVGNRWEWVWGFKMVDGRIFLAPDNDRSAAESSWVDTGWDMPSNRTWSSMDNTGAGQDVKRALIVPNGVADPDGYLYTNLSGERFPYRGGSRGGAGNAGLGALNLRYGRTVSHAIIGLRLSRLV